MLIPGWQGFVNGFEASFRSGSSLTARRRRFRLFDKFPRCLVQNCFSPGKLGRALFLHDTLNSFTIILHGWTRRNAFPFSSGG